MGQNPLPAKEKSKTNPPVSEKEEIKSLKLWNGFCNIDAIYNRNKYDNVIYLLQHPNTAFIVINSRVDQRPIGGIKA